ncbi:MAG TPA: alkaline phosphatase family protein [Candidatus Babeliales bacterium]|nr:alkaline phosphatase family protein [Candidatus Babeliales bacterium]
MKKYSSYTLKILYISTFFMNIPNYAYNNNPPRLTVILVVDQCAYSYFNKLMPHFKYGLKYLMENGVVYTNAYMPHGQPGTATGHAGLNTGTCAKDHGFVSNSWYENGKKIACDDDIADNTHVINPTDDTTYDYGKSAHMLMVDGLSDQCVLQSKPRSTFTAYSISGKSRSAIATASKLGKPLWIDPQTGLFTSSKAYFDTLPAWLQEFNLNNNINKLGSITWQPMYKKSPYSYNFFNINNYNYTRTKKTMLNTKLRVPDTSNPQEPYHLFEKTPQANQYILDCAQSCIKTHVGRKHRDRLLLWVCLSPLDKIGHKYGPNSMETIDMIYHLDKQLQRFMRQTLRIIGKHEIVFALTADHGIMPIPELLHEQGLTQAHRIERIELIKNINDLIEKKYSIKNLVVCYKGQELLLNSSETETLKPEQHSNIISDIKLYLLQQDGIKNVWSSDELSHLPTQLNTLEDNIKKQLFKGRSGSIIIQTYPYTVITHWPNGASHKTPYNYDTNVPLIIFHPGKFERCFVRERVAPLQLANTLAEILNVPKPSASTYEILPGLFDPKYK